MKYFKLSRYIEVLDRESFIQLFCLKSKSENQAMFIFRKLQITLEKNALFFFLLPISRESVVLGSNFRSGDLDGFHTF